MFGPNLQRYPPSVLVKKLARRNLIGDEGVRFLDISCWGHNYPAVMHAKVVSAHVCNRPVDQFVSVC